MNERLEYSCVLCDPDWCGEERKRKRDAWGRAIVDIPTITSVPAALACSHVMAWRPIEARSMVCIGRKCMFQEAGWLWKEVGLRCCNSLFAAARVTHVLMPANKR